MAILVPFEHAEAVALAAFLERTGVLYFHVPNELPIPDTKRRIIALRMLRDEGMQPGCPDYFIFATCGTIALELKRRYAKGFNPPKPSKLQLRFHERLRMLGVTVLVCYGAADAVLQLKGLGIVDSKELPTD